MQLPTPPPALIAHSATLRERIQREIQDSGGAIGFDRYFDLCQYAPGLGYYSAGLRKFGAGGDFVTAPELGCVFARCVAREFARNLRRLAAPKILEVGGGSGAFAVDALQELARADCLPDAYWMLERSADLRARQRERFERDAPDLLARVRWLDAPPDAPWHGIVFGNEVLDALAPKRFEISDRGAYELCVAADDNNEFHYVIGERLPELEAWLGAERLAQLPLGYRSEWQPVLTPWIAALTRELTAGELMMIDYGYTRAEFYLPERTQGSLVCHYQQRMFDAPFWYPGLVDLSSSVDFTALAEAGEQAGLAVLSYQTQSEFVLTHLIDVAPDLAELPERERLAITRQIRMLCLPGEMGERMQVMRLGRPG
jgi:SAM-dependent MidA family methyltransferase